MNAPVYICNTKGIVQLKDSSGENRKPASTMSSGCRSRVSGTLALLEGAITTNVDVNTVPLEITLIKKKLELD
jgi:hypothetical protein